MIVTLVEGLWMANSDHVLGYPGCRSDQRAEQQADGTNHNRMTRQIGSVWRAEA